MRLDIIIPTCKDFSELSGLVAEIEQNTESDHRIIATCQKVSAAKNRNYGLAVAQSSLLLMIDDDMADFFPGWEKKVLQPLEEDPRVCMVSARLLTTDGSLGQTSADDYRTDRRWCYVERKVMPSAAIAFRDEGLRFDEAFVGSGWEDTDFCFQYHAADPRNEFVINNECPLVHRNEGKNQGEVYERNWQYFSGKWGGKVSPVEEG